ncbi:MAG: PIN domain-containing protein [Ancalomicrobiaceae bacterium]|nr:PIN domain-containing protein [Ancalomicrobiaceae bacterium]
MRIAVDINVLVYAQGLGDPERIARALDVLDPLELSLVVPTQVLGEAFNVLTRKFGLSSRDVLEAIAVWSQTAEVFAGPPHVMLRAVHLATDHRFQIWDAFIIETAVEADCTILLSEDMQHGFFWNGLTIINPFIGPEHPLLSAALSRACGS